MKPFGLFTMGMFIGLLFSSNEAMAQESTPATHIIFMAVVEVKGGTSVEKFAPPPVNPKALSKGYELKTRSEANKSEAKRWEVSSYMFSPNSVTVRQGDTVKLQAIVVDADEHHVRLNDPDGREVIAETKWNYEREHQLSFVAKKIGAYQLTCSDHAPTMAATFLVLPRK
jgi:plastocyanin